MSVSQVMTTVRHKAPSARVSAAMSARNSVPVTRRLYVAVKAGLEWVSALVLLVIHLPVLLALAVLLKATSEGPVFYHQTRLGRGRRPFQIYKLRTMTHGCEANTGPVWSIGGDPRVTKVGRWLRDTHLDELPQLWNVLRGDMSLIGPRPERPAIAEKIERAMPEFAERLAVRPGISGLAQMRLPADSDLHMVRRKLAHDLFYIEHLGPLLDAAIIVSTIAHLVGVATTALSRQVVQPFAPSVPTDELLKLTDAELPVVGGPIGRIQETKDDLPLAA